MSSLADASSTRRCLAVVLAAGEGTRMKSSRPKVLHEVAGRSMIGHVLAAVSRAGASRAAVVVGPEGERVAREATTLVPGAEVYVQSERSNRACAPERTGGARKPGRRHRGRFRRHAAHALRNLRAAARPGRGAAVVALGFDAKDPTGYGRFIETDGHLAIREHRDASPAERAITRCNAGLMALRGDIALRILDRIDNKNAKGEYYLTDAVEVAQGLGLRAVGDCARGGGPGRQRQGAARGRREGPPEPLAHGGNGVGRR